MLSYNQMLFIQDSAFSQSYSLHEALIKSCSSSIKGYGAYAFASSSGVNILLKDREFDALLERGDYSIIVGKNLHLDHQENIMN